MTKDEFFPLSNQSGSVTALNNELMHQMSETSAPIDSASFETMLKDHHIFLESAGREGKWQTLEVAGLTMAIYTGGTSANGKQASFLNCNLSLLQFNELDLACADFVNVFYKNGSFRNANLKNSIFIDSVLIGTDFSGADLSGCDFSRALLMNCQFSNAKLSSCDFENCNLSNSNFIGATTTGSRFPGAILENAIF